MKKIVFGLVATFSFLNLLSCSNDNNIEKENTVNNRKSDSNIFIQEKLSNDSNFIELVVEMEKFKNYTKDITQYNVYQDLIDESQYHLKCFGNMLSLMGILAIPRTVITEMYQKREVKQFLIDGIEEEKMAKEECQKLALAVKDEELSKFFEFFH